MSSRIRKPAGFPWKSNCDLYWYLFNRVASHSKSVFSSSYQYLLVACRRRRPAKPTVYHHMLQPLSQVSAGTRGRLLCALSFQRIANCRGATVQAIQSTESVTDICWMLPSLVHSERTWCLSFGFGNEHFSMFIVVWYDWELKLIEGNYWNLLVEFIISVKDSSQIWALSD